MKYKHIRCGGFLQITGDKAICMKCDKQLIPFIGLDGLNEEAVPSELFNAMHREEQIDKNKLGTMDKIFGQIVDGGFTYVTVRQPNHFMRKYSGFGISKSILDNLKMRGVTIIRIVYRGKRDLIYECRLDKYLTSDKKFTFQDKFNRFGGFSDEQNFVSVSDMQEVTI